MTKQEEITRVSNEKGYRVDIDGNVFNRNDTKVSLSVSKKGYASFNIRLSKCQNPTRSFVHRLHAFQKFGEIIFSEDVVVRHLNGISTDNSIDNIGIGSQSDNMLDIPKKIRVKNSSDSNLKHNHNTIISDRNSGMKYSEIMVKHNITSKGTISFIIKESLKSKN
jgi:hypothetical protein